MESEADCKPGCLMDFRFILVWIAVKMSEFDRGIAIDIESGRIARKVVAQKTVKDIVWCVNFVNRC